MNDLWIAIQNNLSTVMGLFGILVLTVGLNRYGVKNPIVLMMAALTMTIIANLMGFISTATLILIIFIVFIIILLYMTIIHPGEAND